MESNKLNFPTKITTTKRLKEYLFNKTYFNIELINGKIDLMEIVLQVERNVIHKTIHKPTMFLTIVSNDLINILESKLNFDSYNFIDYLKAIFSRNNEEEIFKEEWEVFDICFTFEYTKYDFIALTINEKEKLPLIRLTEISQLIIMEEKLKKITKKLKNICQ